MKALSAAIVALALVGCAMKGDVRRVEYQVQSLREETARADSARAAQLASALNDIVLLEQHVLDSLKAQQRRLTQLETAQGNVRSDLTDVQRQLVQVQELLGQSQQRLTDLRRQIDQRQRQNVLGDSGAAAPQGGSAETGRVYAMSQQQMQKGAMQTARIGFQKVLSDSPNGEHAADAQFFLGETWAGPGGNADSAAAAYELVVKNFPTSPRAASALYRLGMLAESKGNKAAARQYFQRVVDAFPASDEAALARDKLQAGH